MIAHRWVDLLDHFPSLVLMPAFILLTEHACLTHPPRPGMYANTFQVILQMSGLSSEIREWLHRGKTARDRLKQ